MSYNEATILRNLIKTDLDQPHRLPLTSFELSDQPLVRDEKQNINAKC